MLNTKRDYLERMAWEIYKKGYEFIDEDIRTLMLDAEDREYVYEQWGRLCAE